MGAEEKMYEGNAQAEFGHLPSLKALEKATWKFSEFSDIQFTL
ncbi:MAG: hypothetical protein VB051_05760 [Candidatus Pelethousia sp.]|nr:hypothetical protein [Candidatus Pelethousia sp.]